MAFWDAWEDPTQDSNARSSNDPNPPQASSGPANRDRSRGTADNTANDPDGAFVLPIFTPWERPFPRWKPSDCSDQEWTMIQALSGNLPQGQDGEFRTRILNLQPLLQHDDANPFLREGKTLAYLTRHCDAERIRAGRTRLSGDDGFIAWRTLEETKSFPDNPRNDTRVLPYHIRQMNALDLISVILFNNKGRFECAIRPKVTGDRYPAPALFIRATQGHSYSLDRNLLFQVPIDAAQAARLNPVLHGTKQSFWNNNIQGEGLVPGGHRVRGTRQAVHFMAMGWHEIQPEGPHSSLRSNADYIIVFDLKRWVTEGNAAYLSPNGVVNIFVPVPTRYFHMHAPITDDTPRNPMQWIDWWRNSTFAMPSQPQPQSRPTAESAQAEDRFDRFNSRYEEAWDDRQARRAATGPTPAPREAQEPADGRREVEDTLLPDIREQSLSTGIFDIYGDQVPAFYLWQFLTEDQRQRLAERDVYGEEAWYHCRGSGFGAYALYLIIRGAKAKLTSESALAETFKPEKWESAILYAIFQGDTEKIRTFINGAYEYIRRDFEGNAQVADMLRYNYRVDLQTMLDYIVAMAPRWTSNRLEGVDWVPMQFRWEAHWARTRQHILICDPSRTFMSFTPPGPEDESARAEYLHDLAHPPVVIDDELLMTPEELAEYQEEERRRRGPRQRQDNLPDVIFLDEGEAEPLSHVGPHNPDEEEPEADFDVDQGLDEPEPFGEQIALELPRQDDTAPVVDDMEVEIIEPAEEAASSSQPSRRINLTARNRVRFNLRRWAQSVVAQERARQQQADEAAHVAEPEGNDEEHYDMTGDTMPNEDVIPPHPRQYIDLSPHLAFLKEALNHPRNAPQRRDDITAFEHGDNRQFSTPEQLEAARIRNQTALSRGIDEEPGDEEEAANLYRVLAEEVIPGRDIDVDAQINQWSGQLVYASLNLGDVRRRPYIPWRGGQQRSTEERSLLVEFLRKCPAHVMCLAESSGVTDEGFRTRLRGWKFVSSYDKNLAVGVRSDGTATLDVIYDSTDPSSPGGREYEDDPTLPMAAEATLWYYIVEVGFGIIDASDHPDYQGKGSKGKKGVRSSGKVHRASFDKVRVMTFVINNVKARTHPQQVRLRLRQLLLDVARYQVDFLGGDANGAIYKYFPSQSIPSIRLSSFSVMLQTLIAAVNSLMQNPAHKIHADLVTSNPQENLLRLQTVFATLPNEEAWKVVEAEDLGPDCVLGVTISWGHSPPLTVWREEKGRELLSAQVDQVLGFSEFSVKAAEYPLLLTNRHLWLNTAGKGDCGWHSPLIIRVRVAPDQNKRKRSAAAAARREEKKQAHWTSWSSSSWKESSTSGTARPTAASSSSSTWTPSVPWATQQSTRAPPAESPSSSSWQGSRWSGWQSWQSRESDSSRR